ncbi:uncharacterized protein VTP21DRAFT_10867 [Calcarisporiella thermophila]|uniref:uncharacterized protein n=1 Tax=Calcarisporiella thermophila TaxID=911321 RepID=UPI0037448945
MASLLFADIHFPEELFDPDTGDFTAPVQTLLRFTPHILSEMPKKVQEPMRREDSDPMFFAAHQAQNHKQKQPQQDRDRESGTDRILKSVGGWMSSELVRNLAKSSFKFCVEVARAYAEGQSNAHFKASSEENVNKRREKKRHRGWDKETLWEIKMEQKREREKDKERREKEQKEKDKSKKEKEKEKEANNDNGESSNKETKDKNENSKSKENEMVVSALGALAALTISLYSSYRASQSWGEVSFYHQLDLLLQHVSESLSSTRAWVEERRRLGLEIPSIVTEDLRKLTKLLDLIQRLDNRPEKRTETAAWVTSAMGGMGALGGLALGSTMVLTGGAVIAVGGLVVGAAAIGRFSGRAYKGARMATEEEARTVLQLLVKNREERAAEVLRVFQELKRRREESMVKQIEQNTGKSPMVEQMWKERTKIEGEGIQIKEREAIPRHSRLPNDLAA